MLVWVLFLCWICLTHIYICGVINLELFNGRGLNLILAFKKADIKSAPISMGANFYRDSGSVNNKKTFVNPQKGIERKFFVINLIGFGEALVIRGNSRRYVFGRNRFLRNGTVRLCF